MQSSNYFVEILLAMNNGRPFYSVLNTESSFEPSENKHTCIFTWLIIMCLIGAVEVVIGFVQNSHIFGFILGVLLCLGSASTCIAIIILERNFLLASKRKMINTTKFYKSHYHIFILLQLINLHLPKLHVSFSVETNIIN